MSLTSDINTGVLNLNTSVNTQLNTCMSSLTTEELIQMNSLLSNTFTQADFDTISQVIQNEELLLVNNVQVAAEALVTAEKTSAEVAKTPANIEVQDNVSAFKIGEMPVQSKKFTSTVDFGVASNALSEDYPNTLGSIDEAKNWYKINKTTGYTEFIHNSGCSLKLDKAGNASIHITGGLKFIVDKDFLLNILGSLDLHSLSNMSVKSNILDIESTTINIKSNSITSAASSWNHTGNIVINGVVTMNGLVIL